MTNLMDIIQLADLAALEVEKSKQSFENARMQLEKSRASLEESQNHFNQILTQSEELGIPKSRIKKIIEERVALLLSSGLISSQADEVPVPRIGKAPKISRKKSPPAEIELNPVPPETITEEIKILHA